MTEIRIIFDRDGYTVMKSADIDKHDIILALRILSTQLRREHRNRPEDMDRAIEIATKRGGGLLPKHV